MTVLQNLKPGAISLARLPVLDDGPRANRATDEMLAVLGHELRGPLGLIRMAVYLMRQTSDEAVRAWAEDVLEAQTLQMSQMIEAMLELARIRLGKARPRKVPVGVGQMVARAIEKMQPCIQENGLVLKLQLPEQPLVVEGDPLLLEQALANLLGNAAKYTDRGGQIWLSVEPTEDEIVLRVRDNGLGIAREAIPHVFDLFWQSPAAVARSQGGLGIGLALVRQISELHGGSVEVVSDGHGQGSEFALRIPTRTGELERRRVATGVTRSKTSKPR